MEAKKLTREAIVTEAIALLEETGLDGVSLHKLAKRVGVRTPSLYWYFPNKNALLDALVEQVFTDCIDSIPDHRDWRPWMRAFGEALLRTQDRTPDFGRLITTVQMSDERFARTTSIVVAKLSQLDAPFAEANKLQSAIQALVTGWSAFAHAPYSDKLREFIDLDALASASLDALIDGWKWD